MIRQATPGDLPRLMEIYAAARQFMRQNGNLTQWSEGYPDADTLAWDIALGRLYVLQEGAVYGCFMLCAGPDETYRVIYDGAWASDTPYGVLHRVAGDGSRRGVLAEAVAFAAGRFDHLRIDTHRDNLPMRRAIVRQGFTHRGTILCHNGTERLAYDRVTR